MIREAQQQYSLQVSDAEVAAAQALAAKIRGHINESVAEHRLQKLLRRTRPVTEPAE